jgi:hypothetical protein
MRESAASGSIPNLHLRQKSKKPWLKTPRAPPGRWSEALGGGSTRVCGSRRRPVAARSRYPIRMTTGLRRPALLLLEAQFVAPD